MAKQAARDISRVQARAGLAPRREPHWKALERGRFVGYRLMSKATAGAWLARYWDGTKYHEKPLGDLAHLPESDRWAEAKRQAEEWFAHLKIGGATTPETIKEACAEYAKRMREDGRENAAKDAEGAFRRLIDEDDLGKLDVTKAKPADFLAWRRRVMKHGAKTYTNRKFTPVRAALRYAMARGIASSDFAWREALKPIEVDAQEGRRTLYLDPVQRKALLDAASDELKPLLKSWMLLPVRPGDIPNLRVKDLDARNALLKVSGKTGTRDIPLPPAALEHFKAMAQDKLPGAWLVARFDGRQWDRFAWREALRAAVKAAGLPKGVVAYTIRHSTISDLVVNGLDIMTVARLAGTSITMIDKHYGKLQQDRARDALGMLAI